MYKSKFILRQWKKNCEDSCTAFNKHFYSDENECLDTCEGLPNLEFANQIDSSFPTRPCQSQCTNSYPYYDSNTNICIQNCETDGDLNKKYRANDGKVCYSSCAEIPGGDYIYELNYICYKTNPGSGTCDYYYIKLNGAKQCTTLSGCTSNNYNYIIGNECRENCDGYYKLEPRGSNSIFYCFETIDDILNDNVHNIKFYNVKSQLCWMATDFPYGYYINNIYPANGGTNSIYEIVKECDYFFYSYTDPNNNIYNRCTNNCKTLSTNQFFLKGQKNCEDSCLKFQKYFYNPNNNECLDTCKGLTNLEFSNPVNIFNECINKCDDTGNIFHDFDNNLCISKCGNGNPNYLYHNGVNHICYPSCREIPDGDYKYESVDQPDNTKICYKSVTLPSTCQYYYMKKDGTLKCVSNINDCIAMHYNYLLGQECKPECNDYYKLEDDFTLNLIKCYKTKDRCNLDGGARFYNTKYKKC